MFAQYSMSPNLPSCPPPMEHSYSTSSEDSVQSSMSFYYQGYPPTSDFELLSQPTSSPSYAPSYASSSLSASSYDSPASFSACDFTPPLVYPAQQMHPNNATYFAPMQAQCVWGAAPAAPGAMPPMDMDMEEIMIPELDQGSMEPEMGMGIEMQMEQQYQMDSPKPMTAPPNPSLPMPLPIPADLHAVHNASSTKPFSCDCGRAFTRPADLKRHQTSVHNPIFQDCPVEECSRKDDHGFPRRDHLIEHLRQYHGWDVPKRRAVRKGVK